MQPYSLDLRTRIVSAVENGTPRAEVLRLFQISAATLKRYLKQQRSTGDLAPRRHTGGPQPRISPEQHPALQDVIAVDPDATLAQTCAQWHAHTGVAVSQATMSRALAQIGWTRKKRP